MSFGTAIVVLFAIACITWLRFQKYRALGSGRPNYTAREQELERQVDEMRQRIAVLERIATDERRGRDLAREIESLRE